ncbi:ABC transporter [Microbacterium paludicola]|uniref:ABC transporter n=1 Tax=Microbacterium paludicola TaxID=300019 RepID=A0A4Y9FT54_9MICO|nr:ABC transporter [Microbacterium paludicola]MBF0817329.1 ABC transporter [Microbacterium paludicola]TFU31703.1 ABC transporter [Microbacterium paludicola]
MSDAKGPGSEPRDGEPIEGDIDRVPAPAEPDTHEPVAGDTGDIPASRREARTNTGATEIVATPQDDAPIAKPAADEPVAEPVESTPAPSQDEQPPHEEPDYAALAADLDDLESRGASTTVTTRSAESERKPDPWFEPADKTQTFTASDAYDAPTAPAVTASEPTAPETSAPAAQPVQQQLPIFVQAPEPPRMRGNRAAAAGIGLVAALVFAILYFAAKLGFGALNGEVTLDNIADASLQTVTSLGFWTTVVVFFLGFWLLGALVNRARWAAWVLLGVFVAIIAYIGHILGALVDAPFWALTASQGFEEVGRQLLSPLAIAAFVFAREITIWFGAWAARRGARVTERNAEAQAEYERTLEAGPRLSA